jgi:nitrate reductase gamma subunit
MSIVAYLIAYTAIVVFLGAVVAKIMAYKKLPQHVRWELYPVAHEEGERAKYGGSYYEDVDWWKKERSVSKLGELKVMIPEILLLKGVWEHNKPLWWVSFPFHFGLYLLSAFAGLLITGAILHAAGVSMVPGAGGIAGLVILLTKILGPISYGLCALGAVGLLVRRLTNLELRNYSSMGHYFNLILFIAVLGVATYTWRAIDPEFHQMRGFVYSLLTFKMIKFSSPLMATQMILIFALMAYIPLTHMSHFFMKYFLWHDIRWGDEPNINTPEIDKRIGENLGTAPTWAAEHVHADGKKNWVEVASFNPMRPEGNESE